MIFWNRIIGVAAALAATAGIAWVSNVPISPKPQGDAVLRLSWSARPERIETCRAQTEEDLAKAILDYDHAIALKPGFAQAYNNRGNAYAMQGNNARAIEDYDRAIKLVPNYASAYQNRAAAHEVLGNKGEAIRDYRNALRLDANLEDSKKGLARLTAAR